MRAIVVGAGVIGAAAARALALSGVQVTVIDRGAAASGTSAACEGNILVSDKAPGPELDMALVAVRRWAEVANEISAEDDRRVPPIEFERKGGVVLSCDARGASALADFCAKQRSAGVQVETLDGHGVRELEPAITPAAVFGAFYSQDAQVQPTIATESLLASARRLGSRIVTHEPVIAPLLTPDGSLRGVRTTAATYEADVVVNAAGPWSGEMAKLLGGPLPVLPRRGMILVTTRMTQRVFHKVYDSDYVGATQSGDADLQTSTVVESTASGNVLIGSSRERVGFDSRIDVGVAAQIATKAVNLFPFLAETQVLRAYVGFRPYLPDHLPVIGPDPRRPGLFHVTGHEGAGIGLSIISADLLCAQMTGAPSPLDYTPFAVDRPSLRSHLEQAS